MRRYVALWGVLCSFGLPCAVAQTSSRDLTEASIEELMKIEVASASKKQRRLSETAASVYVISQEDIRRSGVSAVPELLRMVPGVQVARIDKSTWAISIRGFNNEFSNKLLVLVDGRSVYSNLASGVFWDTQETFLDNIERIEVVRGPGGATWGANAVNGVINIITKHAQDTQGGLAVAGAGSDEQPLAGTRWGGALGSNAFYRIYAQYDRRPDARLANGRIPASSWNDGVSGFRVDWSHSPDDQVMVEGGMFRSNTSQSISDLSVTAPLGSTVPGSVNFSGGHLLGRWTHTQSSRSSFDLQLYYDRYSRNALQLPDQQNTVDFDFQHHYEFSESNEITWGGGYRFARHLSRPTPYYRLDPAILDTHLENIFVQDDAYLIPGRLQLTAGVKLEENSFAGFEVEPTIRLLWSHSQHASSWAAVSRAARTPSLIERNLTAVGGVFNDPGSGLKVVSQVLRSPRFESESLVAYEAGHRRELTKHIYLDVSAFFNRYTELGGIQTGAPMFAALPVPYIISPLHWKNGLTGNGYGGEVALNWTPVTWWRVNGGYNLLLLHIHSPSADLRQSAPDEGTSPSHQGQLSSYLDLPGHFQFDTSAYFIGKLPAGVGLTSPVPSYVRLDARLGWSPTHWLSLSVSGQNLTMPRHLEQVSFLLAQPIEVRRSVLASIQWTF